MISGRRIVITGVTGKAVLPIARALARNNEVIGLARFQNPEARTQIASDGIIPCNVDFEHLDLSAVPTAVDHVLHFAWMRAGLDELDRAIRVNVEGAGLILQHCQSAKSVLVVSSQGVYSPHPDPLHLYSESDPIGRGASAWAQTSPATKLGLEAVARFCGRAFQLPITIARLNTVIGPRRAFFSAHFDAVREQREVVLPGDPNAHNPIHTHDMIAHIEPLLDAAATNALIINWCGDEIVTTQQTLARTADILKQPARVRVVTDPGIPAGNANDTNLRRSITGLCAVPFWTAFENIAAEILRDDAPPA